MAFTVVSTGNTIQAAHITEIQDALSGTSGASQLIKITAVNDASNWALDVRNLDSTLSQGLRVRDSASATIALLAGASVTLGKKLVMTGLGTYAAAANMLDVAATWDLAGGTFNGILLTITNTSSAAASRLLKLATGSVTALSVNPLGQTMIGTDTLNTAQTIGLTINQGANDNEILTLQSSDVTHGMTDMTVTNTYFLVKKVSATDGGAALWALADTGSVGLRLVGFAPTDDTTKSTAGQAYIELFADKKDGVNVQDPGADANLVAIRSASALTKFIFDAEGSFHTDAASGTWTVFDDYDDVVLLGDLQRAVVGQVDPVKTEFDRFVRYNRIDLEQAKIVHFDRDNPGHAMVNQTRLGMLMIGAIQQLSARLERQAGELQTLRQALLPANG